MTGKMPAYVGDATKRHGLSMTAARRVVPNQPRTLFNRAKRGAGRTHTPEFLQLCGRLYDRRVVDKRTALNVVTGRAYARVQQDLVRNGALLLR